MKYVIVGCGSVGAELALALRRGGHAVTLIDMDSRIKEQLDPSLREHLILGNGFDREILLRAGIGQADGLAAATRNDETNVILARLARLFFHVPRVVARLSDPRKAELYRRFGIQTVSPFSGAINRFADLLSYSELDALASLGSGEVEIVRVEVSALLEGRKVSSIVIPGEVHVIALERGDKTFLPTSETMFEQGDAAHIAVLTASAKRLRAMLALP